MKIIVENNKFKKSVLFIHGFGKNGDHWNITEYNREIGIESHIRKTHNTILITLENNDYLRSIYDVSHQIYESIKHLSNIICVTHSYGSFYAMEISISYPKLFTAIIMLDPTLKTNEYLTYLKTLEYSNQKQYQIDNFDMYPNHLNIPNNVIIKIHLNINPSESDSENINYIKHLDQITKHHVKSRLIVHYDISHMIHYKIPHTIIDTIKNI